MFQLESLEDGLYLFALRLFQTAGHTGTSNVIFCNHTLEQVICFDSQVDVSLSNYQRNLLEDIAHISYLFDINADNFENRANISVGFYSIEILGSKLTRSQTAYDTHSILIPVLSNRANVILFRNEDKVMLSMQGFCSDIYLSDWFDSEDDFDQLAERINIANISMKSAKHFMVDFVYNCARWYYIYPITAEEVTYGMRPINCLEELASEEFIFTYENFEERTRKFNKTAESEYGDDYVEQGNMQSPAVNIGVELDLLALEIDIDEEDMRLFEVDFKEDEIFDNNEDEKDEYEFDDFDKEIFCDPVLMVNYLKDLDKKENETSKNEVKQKKRK